MAEGDPRTERQATFAGLAALCGAAGALCAAAFIGVWFTDVRAAHAAAPVTWGELAPVGVVISEAFAAAATGVLCTLTVIHLRVGRIRRAYAIAMIIAGVRGASIALMMDPAYRAAWKVAADDPWVDLVIGFAAAQVILLLAVFAVRPRATMPR